LKEQKAHEEAKLASEQIEKDAAIKFRDLKQIRLQNQIDGPGWLIISKIPKSKAQRRLLWRRL